MFSTYNFIKIFIAFLLASGTSTVPILSDVGKLAGGGVTGSILGFLLLFVFYWFLVSKAFEFLAFTFGGGVGRYSTTKLYRRLQWLTFALFMTLPTLIGVTLIFSATPIAEHSPSYLATVQNIEQQRRAVALARQREQVATARVERQKKINAEEAKQQVAYNAAVQQRDAWIKLKRKTLVAAIEAEITALPEMQNVEQESERLSERLQPIIDKYASEDYNHPTFRLELSNYLAAITDRYGVEFNTKDTKLLIQDAGATGVRLAGVQMGSECQDHFKAARFSTSAVLKIPDGNLCVLAFVLTNYTANKFFTDSGSPLLTPSIEDFSKDYRRFVSLTMQSSDLQKRTDELRTPFQERLDEAEAYTEPEVLRSIYLPIDDSKFPIKTAANFPLRIDQSPIEAADPYFDRISPTFEKHWWWLAIAAFVLWLLIQNEAQQFISRIYARIMRFLDEGRFGFGGSARFASMFEEWGKPYRPGTLFMGRSLYNPFDEVGLDGEAHMITVAGSRGGKGTTAIIPNLLLWKGSCVVVDPKGTNAHVTAEARRKMGQKVYLIDPFGIVTKDSDRFDPFAALDANDILVRERIASIADALVIPDENAREKHWDDGARTIISGLISHVVSGQSGAERWLHTVRDLIKRLPEEQDSMWAEMSVNEEAGGFAKDAAMRYIRGSETNEILGLMSNADKHTEWLSSDVMRSVTSNPTFNLADLKHTPTTVYLIIPPRQLSKQNRLIRLFINLMLDAMEDGGRSEVPVLMMIDEFLALDRMPEIPTAFATMASYNLVIWLFIQDLMGLQKKYKDEFNSFIANSRALQVFATTDDTTKEYVSKRMGNRPMSSLGGIVKSNDNVPLRAPDDIEKDLKADEGRQYVIEAGSPAMLIEKVPYFKRRSRFAGKYAPDPDFTR